MCHHFHLSLQSGCNETLKRMNRRYTTEEFSKGVEMLRKTFDDLILTTDVIVGFPGETDDEFNKTYEYLKNIKFYKMHIFKYSIRKNTVASKMKDQVPGDIKEIRSKKLIELSANNEEEYLKSYIGKTIDVLFEEKDNEYLKGHTANYIYVKAKSSEDNINRICRVDIISTEKEFLIGNVK